MVKSGAYEFAGTEEFIAAAEEVAGPYVWGRYDILLLPPSFPYGEALLRHPPASAIFPLPGIVNIHLVSAVGTASGFPHLPISQSARLFRASWVTTASSWHLLLFFRVGCKERKREKRFSNMSLWPLTLIL